MGREWAEHTSDQQDGKKNLHQNDGSLYVLRRTQPPESLFSTNAGPIDGRDRRYTPVTWQPKHSDDQYGRILFVHADPPTAEPFAIAHEKIATELSRYVEIGRRLLRKSTEEGDCVIESITLKLAVDSKVG